MKKIFTFLFVLVSTSLAQGYTFEEVFTLTDPRLESLAWPVQSIATMPGMGSCKNFLHRVKFVDVGEEDDINVVFHEYLASLTKNGEEMDFAFIRHLNSDLQTISETMRAMAPKDASSEVIRHIEEFSLELSKKVVGESWTYSGGVVRYIDPKAKVATALVNVRMLRDDHRNEYLVWGNGRCN